MSDESQEHQQPDETPAAEQSEPTPEQPTPAPEPAQPAGNGPATEPPQAVSAPSEDAGSERIKDSYDRFTKEEQPTRAKPGDKDQSWQDDGADATDPGPDASYRTRIKGGLNVIGDNATAYQFSLSTGRQITVLRYDRTPEWIDQARSTFVTPPGYPAYREILRETRLLYLRGTPGSGRRLLAEMLLADVADDKVSGIQVTQTDVTLAAFAGETDLLPSGRGTVLELASSGTVGPATLAALAGMADKAGGFLVVLGIGTGAPDQALHPYEVMSPLPNPQAVLERHLTEALRGRPEREITAHVAKCLSRDKVTERLLADPQPASVADLARALAGWDGEDEDLDRALNKIRARVRELAARLVKGDDDESSLDSPRRQAVQIAYAAFDGYPLSDVFGVGNMLLEILLTVQSGEERSTRSVFDAGVDRMLQLADGTVMVRLDGADHPRRARFTDPGFAFDLLDVVWNDFDSVRVPLLFWLHRIVLTGRAGTRQRAAYIAGWLATHDFDEVWRLLIRPWARADNGAARQAAAWAVDILAIDGRMLGHVRGRVRDWVRSSDPRLHDTAARSYGTQLGAAFVDDALADLETLAGRDDLNGSASVAAALRFLYVTAPDPARAALVAWNSAEKYRMRVHAARSLILISSLAGQAPREKWPRLLAHAEDSGGLDGLVEVWQAALTDPTTALRAWKAFHNWLQWAGADPDLEERTVQLGVRILAARSAQPGHFNLKTRGRFYLRQWRASCPAARRLFAELWPAGHPETLGEVA